MSHLFSLQNPNANDLAVLLPGDLRHPRAGGGLGAQREGAVGAKAKRIPRQYLSDLSARDRVAAALIRKSQYRLIDSNKQSNMLGLEIDRIADLVEQVIGDKKDDNGAVTELRKTLDSIRNQVVFDKHLAHYPNTSGPSKADAENAENFG